MTERGSVKVLIVDASDECREVLCTVLRRRGFSTLEAAGARRGLEMLQLHRPRLVVFDSDCAAEDESLTCSTLSSRVREHNSQLLVLGGTTGSDDTLCEEQVVSKPYHFGPLIRTIERLLER